MKPTGVYAQGKDIVDQDGYRLFRGVGETDSTLAQLVANVLNKAIALAAKREKEKAASR